MNLKGKVIDEISPTVSSISENVSQFSPSASSAIDKLHKSSDSVNIVSAKHIDTPHQFSKNTLTEQTIFIKDSEVSVDILKLFGSILNGNSTIKKLLFSDGVEIDVSVFRQNNVKFINRGYDIKACAVISSFLEIHRTMTCLDLTRNKICDSSVSYLARALEINGTVTNFKLSRNYIKDIGAKELSRMLNTNRTLKNVYVDYNQIGDTGAISIAEALKLNSTLESLYINGNEITDLGANSFQNCLEINKTLKKLIITFNSITKKEKKRFRKILDEHSSLLYLGHNFFT